MRFVARYLVVLFALTPFVAAQTKLAATPPMGWNSWNWFARKVTDKDWHVSEWSGENGGRHDFTLKRAEWPVAHVTIGLFKRR